MNRLTTRLCTRDRSIEDRVEVLEERDADILDTADISDTSDTADTAGKNPRWPYSIYETAQKLGCLESNVYDLIGEGVLPYVTVGRRMFVPQAAVHTLMRQVAWRAEQ